jgi:hypothetical protein
VPRAYACPLVTINPGYQAPEARQPHSACACAARVRLGKTRFAYDAAQGVRISRDPIGEDGGINLYGFVFDNPISLIVPFGLGAHIWVYRTSMTSQASVFVFDDDNFVGIFYPNKSRWLADPRPPSNGT